MVRRENKNNAYAKFGGTNKEYYGIFRTGLFKKLETKDKFKPQHIHCDKNCLKDERKGIIHVDA